MRFYYLNNQKDEKADLLFTSDPSFAGFPGISA